MHRRRMCVATALVLCLALLLVGCERRSQQEPSAQQPSATLRVTADYGQTVLMERSVAPDQSVMRALRGATEVSTLYGGGFVSEMFGHTSDLSGGRDWFFFVDGIHSPVGARDIDVAEGDEIWWDFRQWAALMDTPAVVGAWPAPFTGRRVPRVHADDPLDDALIAAGATVVYDPDTPWRVRVGTSDELAADDPAWARALADPDAAGLTAAIEQGRVVALDAAADRRRPVPGGQALAVALASGLEPTDGVLLAVVGLTPDAARAAARTIAAEPQVLRSAYAVVFDGDGRPIGVAGADRP